MKIVQVVPRLESGGVERGTVEVATALAATEHDPIVISEGGRMVAELAAHGVRHVQMQVGRKTIGCLSAIRQLESFFNQEKVDIVHCRSRLPAWLTMLALGRMSQSRPRFVTSVHGLHSVSRYSAIVARGDRVEVVSRTAREYLEDNYQGVDPDKIRLILRGIDPEKYYPSFRPSQDWIDDWNEHVREFNPDALPVVTLAGRISRLKGHDDFLSVLEMLNRGGRSCKGLIVGGHGGRHTRYAESLKKRVQGSSMLRNNVWFAGHRSDLREILSASDVVLSLSRTPESFGRTVLEALSLGIPVVAYDHGGVGEILQELYPRGATRLGDLDSVASNIKAVLDNSASIADHTMTLQRMCSETIAMYEELAAC